MAQANERRKLASFDCQGSICSLPIYPFPLRSLCSSHVSLTPFCLNRRSNCNVHHCRGSARRPFVCTGRSPLSGGQRSPVHGGRSYQSSGNQCNSKDAAGAGSLGWANGKPLTASFFSVSFHSVQSFHDPFSRFCSHICFRCGPGCLDCRGPTG